MGLRFTSAADYATRAMIHLACLPEGSQALRDEIASAERIPSSFMAKILRSLVRAQLLRSARGVNGGFSLAKTPQDISLLEIIEAVEGPINLTDCSTDTESCDRAVDCPAAPVWINVQTSMKDILGDTTLEALVSTPRRHGRVVGTTVLRVVENQA
jgi:Rrf2 family protein